MPNIDIIVADSNRRSHTQVKLSLVTILWFHPMTHQFQLLTHFATCTLQDAFVPEQLTLMNVNAFMMI